MKQITLENPVLERDIKFAKMNKNETLQQYKDEVNGEYGYDTEKVGVKKFIFVNNDEWNTLTTSFLTSYPELWEKLGGSFMTEADKITYGFDKIKTDDEFIKAMQDPAKLDLWRKHSYVETIKVINIDTGECIWVNPEGYEYARYVGI